jgi:hypothetical protein
VVVHACNASTWEIEAEDSEYKASLSYIANPTNRGQHGLHKESLSKKMHEKPKNQSIVTMLQTYTCNLEG